MPWLQTLANGFISLSLIFLPEKGGNNPHLTRLIRSIGGIQVSCPCTHPFKDKNGKPPFRRPRCLHQLPLTASSLTPAFPPQGPSLPESQYLEPGAPWCRAEVGGLAGLWLQVPFPHCHHDTQPQAQGLAISCLSSLPERSSREDLLMVPLNSFFKI